MTLIAIAFTTGGQRDRLRGPVNLTCPECARIAAPVEGVWAPWCSWCRQWLCSPPCAQRHVCRGFLVRLVAA
jgi:hypothetical protein